MSDQYIDRKDFPTIQAAAILAGNALPIFGDEKDIPEVARLLQAQQVLVEQAKIIQEGIERDLREARHIVLSRESAADRIRTYLEGLIEKTARDTALSRDK